MKCGGLAWWSGKVRRFRTQLAPRVADAERLRLAEWLAPGQVAVFNQMIAADQRHGLDVVAALRGQGISDADVLTAGLLHDAGKGSTGVLARVAHSLGQAYGAWIPRLIGQLPGTAEALARLEAHPELSARIAEAAGCSPRTVDLIRWQEDPRDLEFGERLRLADEAN